MNCNLLCTAKKPNFSISRPLFLKENFLIAMRMRWLRGREEAFARASAGGGFAAALKLRKRGFYAAFLPPPEIHPVPPDVSPLHLSPISFASSEQRSRRQLNCLRDPKTPPYPGPQKSEAKKIEREKICGKMTAKCQFA